jgi:hypothetical protein
MERLKNIEALRNLRALLVHDVYGPGKNVAKVCCGLPCNTLGSHKVAAALEAEGVAAFERSFDGIVRTVDRKRAGGV